MEVIMKKFDVLNFCLIANNIFTAYPEWFYLMVYQIITMLAQ